MDLRCHQTLLRRAQAHPGRSLGLHSLVNETMEIQMTT
jgi:hypothetical protein